MFTGNVNAQEKVDVQEKKGSFSMHAGLSLPMGDFGDDDEEDEDSGLAGIGINIGMEYVYQLNESGLGLFVGLDMFRNGLNSDFKDDIEDDMDSGDDVKFPVYYNIPLSAGLVYNYKVDEKIALFGKGGLVFNSLLFTDWEFEGDNYDVTTESDLATSFGLKFGAGITFSEKWSIEIDYLGLGEHEIDSETEYESDSGDDKYEDSRDLKVNIVSVTLGYKF